jgi:hypothetical protein
LEYYNRAERKENEMGDKLLTAIGEALGEASMCWSETPKGEFDSSRAQAIAVKLRQAANEHFKEEIDDSAFLNALEAAGVDNWSGYGEAQDILKSYDDESRNE